MSGLAYVPLRSSTAPPAGPSWLDLDGTRGETLLAWQTSWRTSSTGPLYAALESQSGLVLGKTAERHTSDEFVVFLEQIVDSQPATREIHPILLRRR